MTDPSSINHLLRSNLLSRDSAAPDKFSPASGLRVARPIDADNLVGRMEGRARKVAGGASRPNFSSALQQRIGKSRKLRAIKSGQRGAFQFDARQRATVKLHYFSHAGGGAATLKAHARYVARDAAAKEQDIEAPPGTDRDTADGAALAERQAQAHARYLQRGQHPEHTVFYDALGDNVDGGGRAALWAKDDRRHFRLILAPENGTRLGDLKDYTRDVMNRAEAALGTRLEWVAVDHWDTANPHTHIILRGRREDGRDLMIPRDYVSHGFRNAARDAATDRLGARTREDERLALQSEVRAHRPTRLDPIIEAQLDANGRIRIARLEAPNGAPEFTDALKARAHELKRLGLATEIKRNELQFEPGWREGLKAMELHLDIRKALLKARTQDVARARDEPAKQLSKALRLPFGLDR